MLRLAGEPRAKTCSDAADAGYSTKHTQGIERPSGFCGAMLFRAFGAGAPLGGQQATELVII